MLPSIAGLAWQQPPAQQLAWFVGNKNQKNGWVLIVCELCVMNYLFWLNISYMQVRVTLFIINVKCHHTCIHTHEEGPFSSAPLYQQIAMVCYKPVALAVALSDVGVEAGEG